LIFIIIILSSPHLYHEIGDLILLDVPAANLQGGGEAGAEAEQNV